MERLQGPAGSTDDDRAIAHYSSSDALIDADALDFVEEHLGRFFLNKTGFENNPLVGDCKFRARPAYRSDENRNSCDRQDSCACPR